MRGWRLVAIVPLTVVVLLALVGVALFFSVAIPFSVSYHLLNDGGTQ